VLQALENDHEYLMEGNVFTKDLIETWIDYKREKEIKPLAQRPHPYEFELYYGVYQIPPDSALNRPSP
jgi:glutamine synthetase